MANLLLELALGHLYLLLPLSFDLPKPKRHQLQTQSDQPLPDFINPFDTHQIIIIITLMKIPLLIFSSSSHEAYKAINNCIRQTGTKYLMVQEEKNATNFRFSLYLLKISRLNCIFTINFKISIVLIS